jgi:hypothetical protein
MIGWMLRGVLLAVAARVIAGMFRGSDARKKQKELAR